MATLKLIIANMAVTNLYTKKKVKKTRFVEPDSDSESKSESESEDKTPLPPTPPRKKRKAGKSNKAKAPLKYASKKASKFTLGCDFKPSMKWDVGFGHATKRDFMNKRRNYGREHPDWAMDQKTACYKQQLEEFAEIK